MTRSRSRPGCRRRLPATHEQQRRAVPPPASTAATRRPHHDLDLADGSGGGRRRRRQDRRAGLGVLTGRGADGAGLGRRAGVQRHRHRRHVRQRAVRAAIGLRRLRHVPLRRRVVHALRQLRTSSQALTRLRRPAHGGSGRRLAGAALGPPPPHVGGRCITAGGRPVPYDVRMLRMLTAGESHGKALVAVLEGLPAGVPVDPDAAGAPARPPTTRSRPRRAPALRVRPLRDPGRRPARSHAGLADRRDDPEPRVRREVRGAHGGHRRGRARQEAHAAPAGPRRPGRDRRSTGSTTFATCWSARAPARRPPAWRRARSADGSSPSSGVELVSHVVRIGSVKVPARAPAPASRRRRRRSTARRCAASTPTSSKAHGRRDRPPAEGARHRRRGLRGAGLRRPAGARLVRALRPQARRPARAGAHEHPVGEGRRGRRRVRDRREARLEGARRDRGARRAASAARPRAPAASRAA